MVAATATSASVSKSRNRYESPQVLWLKFDVADSSGATPTSGKYLLQSSDLANGSTVLFWREVCKLLLMFSVLCFRCPCYRRWIIAYQIFHWEQRIQWGIFIVAILKAYELVLIIWMPSEIAVLKLIMWITRIFRLLWLTATALIWYLFMITIASKKRRHNELLSYDGELVVLWLTKGLNTLCVQSAQSRTRSSDIAFLRTVVVWLSTCIPYQLNNFQTTQKRNLGRTRPRLRT